MGLEPSSGSPIGSCEIEEQDLGGFMSGERDGQFIVQGCPVPGLQTLIDEPNPACNHVKPRPPSGTEFMNQVIPRIKSRGIDANVLLQAERSGGSVR
jgi:hypothetical protein